MPKGFKSVRKVNAQIQQRKDSGGQYFDGLYFSIPKDGGTAIVRFLEEGDDIVWRWVHALDVPGRQFPDFIPCIDQDDDDEPCPGCEAEMKRSFKGYINVIWDDAPVYERDDNDKIVKDRKGNKEVADYKTQNAVWTSGIQLFDQLGEIDETYDGLRACRFKIKRKGMKLSTTYIITPENPRQVEQKFSLTERKLDKKKHDLAATVAKIPTYDEFEARISGESSSGYTEKPRGKDAAAAAKKSNPFMRSRPQ